MTTSLIDTLQTHVTRAQNTATPDISAKFDMLAKNFIPARHKAMDILQTALGVDLRVLSHPAIAPDIIVNAPTARLTIRNAAHPYYTRTQFPTESELTHYSADQIRLVIEQTQWRGTTPYFSVCTLWRKGDDLWNLTFANTYSTEQSICGTDAQMRDHLAKWLSDKGIAQTLHNKLSRPAPNKKPAI